MSIYEGSMITDIFTSLVDITDTQMINLQWKATAIYSSGYFERFYADIIYIKFQFKSKVKKNFLDISFWCSCNLVIIFIFLPCLSLIMLKKYNYGK
jgi:hypothetical protein